MKVGKVGVDNDSFSIAVNQGVCNNFFPSNFANKFELQGDRGVCWFWVTVDTQNSKGWIRSHREDSTANQLTKFLAKHVMAPPNVVVGEHSKNPN